MNWMKIELELPDKPEVHEIAGILNLDPDAVVGKLIRVWGWFDKHTTDGNAVGVTYSLLDRFTCVTGFAEAMSLVGWLEQKDSKLVMPNFDRHNGESAKKRAQTAKRVAKSRENSCNAQSVTKALPEKIREDNKTPIVPFDQFWSEYPKKVSKGQAEKTWAKLKPDSSLMADILQGLKAAKASDQWSKHGGQFIPHASTWLNAKGWEDQHDLTNADDFAGEML